jgi:hydrogenase/urease accessory protein HupE
MRHLLWLGTLLALLAATRTATAHSFAPGLLTLRERSPGHYDLRWTPPGGAGVVPQFPGACRASGADAHWDEPQTLELSCGDGALRGNSISMAGLARVEVLVDLSLADGHSQLAVLRADSPSVLVATSAGAAVVLKDFLRLGAWHILTGFDHLLFVLGLILLVRGWRRLALTITCFTLAHSLTLALAVLGVVHVPARLVEALIALSIVFVALELLRPAKDRTSRPWLVALAFGLLHGLGFAGALVEVGLPVHRVPWALFSFNVGVELGQLAVVLAACGLAALGTRVRLPWLRLRAGLVYAMGSLAAMWTFERVSRFFVAALAVGVWSAGCSKDTPATFEETRQPCAHHNPLKNAYFGDLHVHTSYSFDAYALDTRNTPADAYRFARGEAVSLPPLDADGKSTQSARLARALDFTAVTDHSEFLAEVETCVTPGSFAYDAQTCKNYRAGSFLPFGVTLTDLYPSRIEDICGLDGTACRDLALQVWERMKQAAEDVYDRTASCSFTSFIAYEYTAVPFLSNMHRNVIFKNERVPFPISYYEEHTPQALWKELKATCIDAGTGCDVLAIPHNSNLSNGNLFAIEKPEEGTTEAEQAALRAELEPLVEIYQHKGDSECSNGLQGPLGIPDELCDFEKLQPAPAHDCAEEGSSAVGGQAGRGCVSQRDFVRSALLLGLQEEERLGVNPYQMGIIASTDTHNGTPGHTDEASYVGHFGKHESVVAGRLQDLRYDQGGVRFSGGGLTGVWAEENSRPSLFDAMRKKETFGTSGTRLTVRFFGGWSYSPNLCGDAEMLKKAYAQGVPMGGLLVDAPAGSAAPTFLVSALRDPGDEVNPGVPLARMQVIKGFIEGKEPKLQVFEIAGKVDNGATVDENTCQPKGAGADALCTVWTDPAFQPGQRAFYYVRVLENPTCRWHARQCLALAPEMRPASCSDPSLPKVIHERAWTSPIWYRP